MASINNPFSESHLYVPEEQIVYKVVESDFIFNSSRKPEEGPTYHMFGQGTYVFFDLDGALDFCDCVTGGRQKVATFRILPDVSIFDYIGIRSVEDANFELTDELLRLYVESVKSWTNISPYVDKASLLEDIKRVSKRLGRLVNYNDLIHSREKQHIRDSRAVFSLFLKELGYSGIAFWYDYDAGNIWDMSCLEFEGFLDEDDAL